MTGFINCELFLVSIHEAQQLHSLLHFPLTLTSSHCCHWSIQPAWLSDQASLVWRQVPRRHSGCAHRPTNESQHHLTIATLYIDTDRHDGAVVGATRTN